MLWNSNLSSPLFRTWSRVAADGSMLWVCAEMTLLTLRSISLSPQGRHQENRPVRIWGIWIHQPPAAIHRRVCMKERRSFLLRPPTVCPSCRLSQKPLAVRQLCKASRRVKDDGEDELTLWTCQQGKQGSGRVSFLDDSVLLGIPNSSFYKENKEAELQEHSLSFHCLPPFSFLFLISPGFIPLFRQNVHPHVKARLAL